MNGSPPAHASAALTCENWRCRSGDTGGPAAASWNLMEPVTKPITEPAQRRCGFCGSPVRRGVHSDAAAVNGGSASTPASGNQTFLPANRKSHDGPIPFWWRRIFDRELPLLDPTETTKRGGTFQPSSLILLKDMLIIPLPDRRWSGGCLRDVRGFVRFGSVEVNAGFSTL